jgi:hypothetical protein
MGDSGVEDQVAVPAPQDRVAGATFVYTQPRQIPLMSATDLRLVLPKLEPNSTPDAEPRVSTIVPECSSPDAEADHSSKIVSLTPHLPGGSLTVVLRFRYGFSVFPYRRSGTEQLITLGGATSHMAYARLLPGQRHSIQHYLTLEYRCQCDLIGFEGIRRGQIVLVTRSRLEGKPDLRPDSWNSGPRWASERLS